MLVQDDGDITTLAVDPAWHGHQVGTRLLMERDRRGRSPRRQGTSRSRCGSATSAPRALPAVRPGARRHPEGLLRRDERGRAGHVGARRGHRAARGFARALARAHPRHNRPRGARTDHRAHRAAGGGRAGSSASSRRATRPPRPIVRARHVRAVLGRQQPGRAPRPLRRGRARDRQPCPRRPARARRGPGLRRGRRSRTAPRPGTRRRGRRHRTGPGLVGALLVGVSRGQGARARVGRPLRRS